MNIEIKEGGKRNGTTQGFARHNKGLIRNHRIGSHSLEAYQERR